MEGISDNKVDLWVEVDLQTANALQHIARFEGCTVEELVERYLRQELDKLPNPAAPPIF